jgi:hypothetical protein
MKKKMVQDLFKSLARVDLFNIENHQNICQVATQLSPKKERI